jgi:hypothetical protein
MKKQCATLGWALNTGLAMIQHLSLWICPQEIFVICVSFNLSKGREAINNIDKRVKYFLQEYFPMCDPYHNLTHSFWIRKLRPRDFIMAILTKLRREKLGFKLRSS